MSFSKLFILERDLVFMTQWNNLANFLEITYGSIVSVIGCGGKTSLINLIARCNADKKVLISPTTKMFPLQAEDITQCYTVEECGLHIPHIGVQIFGQLNKKAGKLKALPEEILKELIQQYDIVLLEADGSRSLPFKGWLDNEPVVPNYTTHTVGVVALNAIGVPATEENVHNLSEFLSLTGLIKGDTITDQAVESMVCSPQGMFKNAVGEKYLVIPNIESEAEHQVARAFCELLKENHPKLFKCTVYGSSINNIWHEV